MRSLFFVLCIIGCSQQPKFYSVPDQSLQQQEAEQDGKRIFRNADRPQKIDVQKYNLEGEFDWDQLLLKATVTLQILPLESSYELILDSRVEVKSVLYKNKKLAYVQNNSKGELKILLPEVPADLYEIQIAYEASGDPNSERALHAVPPRKGDPIQSRALFTLSEPLGAADWMPCHNTPQDRALYSTQFKVAPNETFIANGKALPSAAGTFAYATDYPLPTYLMAIAVGEFEKKGKDLEGLPLAIYYRRGLPIDSEGVLTQLSNVMAHYQKLLIPYPFEKYAIVLLPDYRGGGIEHAGITFQTEVGSSQVLSYDFGLMAHELGHQWFGDLVTVKDWDSLWIKEGMATLLAEEASRSFEDQNQAGRLFGRNFWAQYGDAIIDPELEPDLKYTSGPYGRSAWFFTQLRSLLGEEKFWGSLRQLLKKYAFAAISTDDLLTFLKEQHPSLDLARLRLALKAKGLPELELEGTQLTLQDPEKASFVPLSILRIDGDLKQHEVSLIPGESIEVDPKTGEWWILDPKDIHSLPSFARKKMGPILEKQVPINSMQLNLLSKLGANVAINAFERDQEWAALSPENFELFLKSLPSEEARYDALQQGCEWAKENGKWTPVLQQAFQTPPLLGIPRVRNTGVALSHCPEISAPSDLKDEKLMLWYSLFPADPENSFNFWVKVTESAASVRMKEIALYRLLKHAQNLGGFTKPKAENLAIWKKFFQEKHEQEQVVEIKPVLEMALKVLH